MWLFVTSDSLKARLTSAELNALGTVQVEPYQADPVDEAVRRAVEEARGYLGARDGGAIGPVGTVPAQIEGAVLDLARYRLCSRLSVGRLGSTLLPDARTQEYKDALELLKLVSEGNFAVEEPGEDSTTLGPDIGSTPIINPRQEAKLP